MKKSERLPGAAVALAAAAVCLPLLTLPLVFDDVWAVRDNPLLRQLPGLSQLFGRGYTLFFRNEGYEPFTFLPVMLAGRLSAWQPWGLHLLSLLAHAACAWAVYRLAAELLRDREPALLAGLFFALHPVQSESLVAALFSGTIFSAFFFLWALRRFIAGDGRGGAGAALLTGLLYGTSLLFKERAFSGLLLFALLPLLRRDGGTLELRRRTPELLALAAFWAAALALRAAAGRGSPLGAADLDPAFLFARLAAYAKMVCLPFWLSPANQRTAVWGDAAGLAALAAAAAALLAASGCAGRGRNAYRPAAVGAALGAVLLLPYLNLLPAADLAEYLRAVFVSGRYLYLPLAGAAIVLGAAASRLAGRAGAAAVRLPAAAMLLCFAGLSVSQQLLWRSDEAVWQRAVALNPRSPWAAYMLGSYYLKEGRPDEAVPLLDRSLELGPDRGERSNALGALAAAALMKGDAPRAEKLALEALKVWDGNYDAWNTCGAALAAQGKTGKAAKAFEVAAGPGVAGAAPLVNLGRTYMKLGRPAEAAGAFARALAFSADGATRQLLNGACAASRGAAPEACGK